MVSVAGSTAFVEETRAIPAENLRAAVKRELVVLSNKSEKLRAICQQRESMILSTLFCDLGTVQYDINMFHILYARWCNILQLPDISCGVSTTTCMPVTANMLPQIGSELMNPYFWQHGSVKRRQKNATFTFNGIVPGSEAEAWINIVSKVLPFPCSRRSIGTILTQQIELHGESLCIMLIRLVSVVLTCQLNIGQRPPPVSSTLASIIGMNNICTSVYRAFQKPMGCTELVKQLLASAEGVGCIYLCLKVYLVEQVSRVPNVRETAEHVIEWDKFEQATIQQYERLMTVVPAVVQSEALFTPLQSIVDGTVLLRLERFVTRCSHCNVQFVSSRWQPHRSMVSYYEELHKLSVNLLARKIHTSAEILNWLATWRPTYMAKTMLWWRRTFPDRFQRIPPFFLLAPITVVSDDNEYELNPTSIRLGRLLDGIRLYRRFMIEQHSDDITTWLESLTSFEFVNVVVWTRLCMHASFAGLRPVAPVVTSVRMSALRQTSKALVNKQAHGDGAQHSLGTPTKRKRTDCLQAHSIGDAEKHLQVLVKTRALYRLCLLCGPKGEVMPVNRALIFTNALGSEGVASAQSQYAIGSRHLALDASLSRLVCTAHSHIDNTVQRNRSNEHTGCTVSKLYRDYERVKQRTQLMVDRTLLIVGRYKRLAPLCVHNLNLIRQGLYAEPSIISLQMYEFLYVFLNSNDKGNIENSRLVFRMCFTFMERFFCAAVGDDTSNLELVDMTQSDWLVHDGRITMCVRCGRLTVGVSQLFVNCGNICASCFASATKGWFPVRCCRCHTYVTHHTRHSIESFLCEDQGLVPKFAVICYKCSTTSTLYKNGCVDVEALRMERVSHI